MSKRARYTVPAAAARLKISRQRVLVLCQRGTLPASRAGRLWMIAARDLRAWQRKPRRAGRPKKGA